MNPKDKRSLLRRVLTRVVELMNHLPGADRIAVRRFLIKSARIPEGFDGCRIVHISDLHGRWFGRRQEKLLKIVRKLKPEIILISGDWVDLDYQGSDERCCQVLVEGLKQIAPIYGIIGNHEARAKHRDYLIDELRRLGVRLLLNESVKLKRKSDYIGLVGFTTPFYAPLKREFSELKLLEDEYREALSCQTDEDRQVYQLAMAHRPELIEMYNRLGLDLVFSGHAHGGLMKLPFGYRLLAPGQSWFPKYTHGLYRKKQTRMIVSCGLGGPRIGIRPEVGMIILKSKT